MPGRPNFDDKRRRAATNLRSLASILFRSGLCMDIGPLSSAADQCATRPGANASSWRYDISNLVFRLDAPGKSIPMQMRDFRLELSISVAGCFECEPGDQFTKMEVDLEKYVKDANGLERKSAWHFDRHVIDTRDDDPRVTDDIHPLYHFQFGGRRMKDLEARLGSTFFVEPPRLMHPPMDAILAIDFVLANYAGKAWKYLRDDNQYVNLVVPQFEQIWKPYFGALADSWLRPRAAMSAFLCPYI